MAPDEPSGTKPAPVVLRIKLRYDDVESMVQRFAPNVGKSGLFLPTKSLQPVGAEVKFELRIADDTPVLVGLGRVKAARAPDPAAPRAAFGMAIELMRVTRESRDVILRMLERRRALGLAEVGIPMPADIDAARRSEVVDTQVKDTVSAAIPAPAPIMESGPSEALMTAPRRQTGPIAVAKVTVVEALAPEPARRPRPRLQEVIDRASGPIVSVVSVEGLDMDVDVPAVLARARLLAGGDLDAELDALREVAAAPLEISIEAASAELARQLGGKPIARRDRSARWEKPPAVIVDSSPAIAVPVIEVDVPDAPAAPRIFEAAPIEKPAPIDTAAPLIESAPVGETRPVVSFERVPERARTPSRPPIVETPTPTPTAVGAPPEPEAPIAAPTTPMFVDDEDSAPVHASPMIHDGADPAEFDSSPVQQVEPEQIADEIHQLADGDYEEVEHTQIGAQPQEGFAQHGYATEPAVADAIERSLDAQLAEAEAEADADDLGISGAYALPQAELVADAAGEEAPQEEEAEEELEEIDDFEILAEADAEDADLLAAHGEAEASAPEHAAGAAYAHAADADYAHPVDAAFSDFAQPTGHVHGRDLPLPPRPLTPLPGEEPRASMSDFVSRLDLSDEFEAATPEPGAEPEPEPEAVPQLEPRAFSGRHAGFSELDASLGALEAEADPSPSQRYRSPAPFDEPAYPDEPVQADGVDADSEQYTLAGQLPPADAMFDAPHGGFARGESIPGFDRSDVIPSLPARQRAAASRATAPPPNEDNLDLESALEALDVDLDDLSVPHERAQSQPRIAPQPRGQRAQRVETKKPVRASTDDGVLIEFEDDE